MQAQQAAAAVVRGGITRRLYLLRVVHQNVLRQIAAVRTKYKSFNGLAMRSSPGLIFYEMKAEAAANVYQQIFKKPTKQLPGEDNNSNEGGEVGEAGGDVDEPVLVHQVDDETGVRRVGNKFLNACVVDDLPEFLKGMVVGNVEREFWEKACAAGVGSKGGLEDMPTEKEIDEYRALMGVEEERMRYERFMKKVVQNTPLKATAASSGPDSEFFLEEQDGEDAEGAVRAPTAVPPAPPRRIPSREPKHRLLPTPIIWGSPTRQHDKKSQNEFTVKNRDEAFKAFANNILGVRTAAATTLHNLDRLPTSKSGDTKRLPMKPIKKHQQRKKKKQKEESEPRPEPTPNPMWGNHNSEWVAGGASEEGRFYEQNDSIVLRWGPSKYRVHDAQTSEPQWKATNSLATRLKNKLVSKNMTPVEIPSSPYAEAAASSPFDIADRELGDSPLIRKFLVAASTPQATNINSLTNRTDWREPFQEARRRESGEGVAIRRGVPNYQGPHSIRGFYKQELQPGQEMDATVYSPAEVDATGENTSPYAFADLEIGEHVPDAGDGEENPYAPEDPYAHVELDQDQQQQYQRGEPAGDEETEDSGVDDTRRGKTWEETLDNRRVTDVLDSVLPPPPR